jgi:hypothetical protein
MLNKIKVLTKSWHVTSGTLLMLIGLIQTKAPTFNLSPEQQGLATSVIGVFMYILKIREMRKPKGI